MKYSIIFFILLILFLDACSKKKEEELKVYNSTAFAYDLGDKSWEVDASARVKGFTQTTVGNLYKASLAYEINLVTPKNDTIKSLISKVVDKSEKERMSDTGLEAQFDLDSTYSYGTYKILWNVKDVATNDTASTTTNFNLSGE
ncbi:MAG: hypothetical protein WCE54_15985 [Ignavibacteriaceae bacterium]